MIQLGFGFFVCVALRYQRGRARREDDGTPACLSTCSRFPFASCDAWAKEAESGCAKACPVEVKQVGAEQFCGNSTTTKSDNGFPWCIEPGTKGFPDGQVRHLFSRSGCLFSGRLFREQYRSNWHLSPSQRAFAFAACVRLRGPPKKMPINAVWRHSYLTCFCFCCCCYCCCCPSLSLSLVLPLPLPYGPMALPPALLYLDLLSRDRTAAPARTRPETARRCAAGCGPRKMTRRATPTPAAPACVAPRSNTSCRAR